MKVAASEVPEGAGLAGPLGWSEPAPPVRPAETTNGRYGRSNRIGAGARRAEAQLVSEVRMDFRYEAPSRRPGVPRSGFVEALTSGVDGFEDEPQLVRECAPSLGQYGSIGVRGIDEPTISGERDRILHDRRRHRVRGLDDSPQDIPLQAVDASRHELCLVGVEPSRAQLLGDDRIRLERRAQDPPVHAGRTGAAWVGEGFAESVVVWRHRVLPRQELPQGLRLPERGIRGRSGAATGNDDCRDR